MGFKQIGGNRVYKSWKEWKKGDTIVGVYESSYTDNFGKTGYQIKVLESTIEGFNQGVTVGLNSTGSLNYKMKTVKENSIIKLVYGGIGKIAKGKYKGKDFHEVNLFVDEGENEVKMDESTESLEGELL